MSALSELGHAAISYADRGWPIFPVRPNDKRPLTGRGHLDATTDCDQVRRWWEATPDANIGLSLSAAGLMAIDADTYKPDCEWQNIAIGREIPATLEQSTARGGRHYFFAAPPGEKFPGKLGSGVDIKHDGYVLLEPSTFAGGQYRIETDDDPAPCPDWVPRQATAETPQGDLTDAERDQALALLGSTPNTLDRTEWIRLCLALKTSLGEVARDAWLAFSARYPGDKMPGDAERVWDTGKPDGRLSVGTVFHLLRRASDVPTIAPTPYVWIDPSSIPPRQWLYGRHLVRSFLSCTVSPGALGKSSLLTVETLAMVSGKALLGQPVAGRLRVWMYNLEDPREEMTRRVQAAAQFYEIGPADIGDRLFLDTGRDQQLCTAVINRDGVQIVRPVMDALATEIQRRQIDVMIVDPFVSSHQVPENDNSAIDAIAKEWSRLADRCGCAIELVHHTRKLAGVEATSEHSRGAIALIAAARDARVLNRMSADEAALADVADRRRYFRVQSDKANMAPPEAARWHELHSVDLANGDHVGVVASWKWPNAFDGLENADLLDVQRAIYRGDWRENVQADAWVGKVVADVLDLDPDDDKTRIKSLLKGWLSSGALVVTEREDEGRKSRKFVEVGEWVND